VEARIDANAGEGLDELDELPSYEGEKRVKKWVVSLEIKGQPPRAFWSDEGFVLEVWERVEGEMVKKAVVVGGESGLEVVAAPETRAKSILVEKGEGQCTL